MVQMNRFLSPAGGHFLHASAGRNLRSPWDVFFSVLSLALSTHFSIDPWCLLLPFRSGKGTLSVYVCISVCFPSLSLPLDRYR